MPQELLRDALARAESAAPAVKAAAWLHAARVLYRFDRHAAVDLLRRAVAVVEMLPEEDREPMDRTAAALAATVSPAAAFALAARLPTRPMHSPLWQMLHNMSEHGFRADAVAYLSDPPLGVEYPFGVVTSVIGPHRNEDDRRHVLRGALRAFARAVEQAPPGTDVFQYPGGQFLREFTFYWHVLPKDEATLAVRAIVRWILASPDQRVNFGAGQAKFSSSRQAHLFEILGPLRALDPDLMQALVAGNPQLKKAAAHMPSGMFGARERGVLDTPPPAPPAPPDESAVAPSEEMDNFGGAWMPVRDAIATGFETAFAAADRLYAADVAPDRPNEHPLEVWPSTAEYRQVLHKAGWYEGRDAVRHLDRLVNPDQRLLASIELAAALVGLPSIGGMSIGPSPRRHKEAASIEELPAWVQERIKRQRHEPLPPPQRPKRPPSRQASVTPTAKKPGERMSGGCGPDFWTIEGAHLRPVLAKLYDVAESRIEVPHPLRETRYDFVLVLEDDATDGAMIRLMKEGIARDLQVTIANEAWPKDALVLTAPKPLTKAVEEFGSPGIFMGKTITWTSSMFDDDAETHDRYDLTTIMDLRMAQQDGPVDPHEQMRKMMSPSRGLGFRPPSVLRELHQPMTMAELADLLELALGRPVVDESGLDGRYALDLETEATTNEEFVQALERAHGIVLTPGKRDVPMLVVRRT